MTDMNVTKCIECSSRDLDQDDVKGETVCNDCGTVLCENQIDSRHPSTQVGDGAHISATRNDSLRGRKTLRTHINPVDARKTGHGNIFRQQQREAGIRNERARAIQNKILLETNSDDHVRAADPILNMCFTKNPVYAGCGELPLNQRFMKSEDRTALGVAKDAPYVIAVCAVAVLRVLSKRSSIPFRFWKEDAKNLGLEVNDCHQMSKRIEAHLKRLYTANKSNLNPTKGMREGRVAALYAFEMKLRNWVRGNKIANAEPLLIWVAERIKVLDDNGDGPMAEVEPSMLLAMITICGLEEFKQCKMTKKGVAEDIFNLTIGGVNSKLNENAGETTKKNAIKKFKSGSSAA